MLLGLLNGREYACGLTNIICTALAPANACRILLMVDSDLFAIDDQVLLATILLGLNVTTKPSMHRIVLELVHHVVDIHEWVVHGNNLRPLAPDRRLQHQSANATETVDAQLGSGRGRDAQELLQRVEAEGLRRLGGHGVLAVELRIAGGARDVLLAHVSLRPEDAGIDHGRGVASELGDALVDGEALGDVLGEVTVPKVWDPAAALLLHGTPEARVPWVCGEDTLGVRGVLDLHSVQLVDVVLEHQDVFHLSC
mmetsp:Transcript_28673/g.82036  ORF Transcript_28673/g.82036 Transcript_28673/m.82036 type:complete len:254 (+) Transcript_28673:791-1552(+)